MMTLAFVMEGADLDLGFCHGRSLTFDLGLCHGRHDTALCGAILIRLISLLPISIQSIPLWKDRINIAGA